MFFSAFLVTLRRLTPALVVALTTFNSVQLLVNKVPISSLCWWLPLEFAALLFLVLLVTPIEYFKLSSYPSE
jgi:hypothetical protein